MYDKSKILVIGLDGGTFDLLKPWVEAGMLPNIASLMKKGVHGDLQTVIHPLTASAWTSFMTGKNPGKHGIFDFIRRKLHSYDIQLVDARHRGSQSLWGLLSESGKKVGVINVPMNYPPEKVNGFIIPWMDAPGVGDNFTYPPDLYNEIKENIGEYIVTVNFHATLDKFLDEKNRMIDNRAEVASYLMRKYPWDFFIVVFSATDYVQHAFWKYADPSHPRHQPEESVKYKDVIFNTYQRIDEKIGKLLSEIDDNTTVIIMSDHGAGPLRKVVNINRWLEENGLLTYKNSARPFLSSLRSGIFIAFSAMKRFLPNKVKRGLLRRFPKTRDSVESFLLASQIDWQRTKAFALGAYGNIWINLKGREPEGIVDEGEYEELRSHIIHRMEELIDPETRASVVEKVYKKEELYYGDYVELAPDLIIVWKDYAYHSRQRFGVKEKSVFSPYQTMPLCNLEMSGFHKPNGILIMKGKNIKKGVNFHGANITDLAPTILYLMGLAVPEDMDGRVLIDAFSEEYLKQSPVKIREKDSTSVESGEGSIYSETEADAVKKRLQDLGYL